MAHGMEEPLAPTLGALATLVVVQRRIEMEKTLGRSNP
jgi:hypothetical protein